METAENNDAIAGNTITMFNLNNQTLKERRKNIMTAVRNMFEGGMDKEEILRIMASDGFVSAVEYELSML